MSIAAPSRNRTWVLVAFGLAAALVGFGVVVYLNLPGERVISPGVPTTPSGTPIVKQAPWKMEVAPAGAGGRVSKSQKAAVARQEVGVTALVREIYDALMLDRGGLAKIVDGRFTEAAGPAFIRATKGILPSVDALKLERRHARIGIDVNGAKRAVARVRIRVSATEGAREALALNTGTLWLERSERGWRVIAYEVDQRPFEPSKNKAGKGARRNGKKGGKKG